MPITAPSSQSLPLPTRIYLSAMEQQLSLAEYAQRLDISAANLRAIVAAQLDQVEPMALSRLADVYQHSPDALHDQIRVAPSQESFAAWLKRNMEGITQNALRTRMHVDAKTLRQFLHAELLPDSDQAERLARALYIDRTELAQVVTASMVRQAGSERRIAGTDKAGAQHTPAATAAAAPVVMRSGRARRQKPIAEARSSMAQEAVVAEVVIVDAEPARDTPAGRQSRATTVESRSAKLPDVSRKALGALRATPRNTTSDGDVAGSAALHEPVQTASGAARNADSVREDVRPRRPAAAPKAAAQPVAPTAGASVDPAGESGAPGAEEPQAPAAHRRAKTAAAAPAAPPSAEPAAKTAGKRLRPTVAQRQVESAPERETSRAADVITAQADPTIGVAEKPSEKLPDVSRKGAKTPRNTISGGDIADSAALPEPAQAASESATVASVLAADMPTLQLTPEEARLIRCWRQLHPHGRRATLHYIGSLLIEE
jgi:plasmid maintenance system antidote protein VapI